MTSRPQARTVRTRERILTAAIDLFLENGFHGTNIDSIAALSRSSKQTIYKYYNDKEEILEHAISRLIDEFSELPLKINFKTTNFKSELTHAGIRYLELILEEREVNTFRLCVEVARKNFDVASSFGSVESERMPAVLAEYIKHLGRRGLIYPNGDAEFMAQAFLGMVRGNFHFLRALDETYRPTKQELCNHVERVTDLFCAALQHSEQGSLSSIKQG